MTPDTTLEYARLRDLADRGWTPAMIRDLLGAPDTMSPGQGFPHFAPVPLFRLDRIVEAEQGGDFPARQTLAGLRSERARVAAARRRERILQMVTPPDLPVPRLESRLLTARAVRHRDDASVDPRSADASTLDRWKVNYLRHEASRYDPYLDGLFGRAGRAEAERLMAQFVYAAIGKLYPDLLPECLRQLGIRAGEDVAERLRRSSGAS
jgi:hypothetical protein